MSLRLRLTLLFVLATALPALPAAWVTRDLLHRSLQIGQRSEIDAGLESGVRLAQRDLRRQQTELRRAARDFVIELGSMAIEASAWPDTLTRIEWIRGDDQRVLRVGPTELQSREEPRRRGEAPGRVRVQIPGEDGSVWAFQRKVDRAWRTDAVASSEALQLVRGFSVERGRIEGAFLRPFLAIYAVALVLSLLVAVWIARGITRPVQGLLRATEAVAAGDWERRVSATGPAELRRLASEFNHMVGTLDAQNRQLVELETLAGWREMARALAHEIKNPLTPIQLTVEEMRHRYLGDDEEYQELLEECTRIVVEEVESLREVVGRFREFSRPVELQPEAIDLNALIADVARLQKDFVVELQLSENMPAVEADPQRMRQLLMNLASNVRNMLEDQPAIRMRIATRLDDDHFVLEVEDNGPGIEVAERHRVFDPYRSGRSGGLGLGLALTKGIVLAHRGRIELVDGSWSGACFVINLPLSKETT
jgi:nitrogen fixation/metabolism regulation signal transduction histidine kinase